MASMLSSFHLQPALTFTSCLCRAWILAYRGENFLGSFVSIRPFLNMYPVLGICINFLTPDLSKRFQKLSFPHRSPFPNLFHQGFLICLLFFLMVVPWPKLLLKPIVLLFKRLANATWEAAPGSGKCSELGKTKASACVPVLPGATRQIEINK